MLPEMYDNAMLNGYDGVCAWKSPQNHCHGTFVEIVEATKAFYEKHPELVDPERVNTQMPVTR